ncbi:MAG: hypothetical protein AAB538_02465 [Patescibacteria group bacterium]
MGLLSLLTGRNYSELQECAQFRQFTNDKRWDILLDIITQKIEKHNSEWHTLKGEARNEACARQKLLYELLNDIEIEGGRIDMNTYEAFMEEDTSPITSHRHLGVPHMMEMEKKEAEREGEHSAG